MIPTLLFVGVLVRLAVGRHGFGRLVLVSAVVSILWGWAVAAGSAATFLGGATLAGANLAVGAALVHATSVAAHAALAGRAR